MSAEQAWEIASRTDTGSVRERNEDAAIAIRFEEEDLYLLAVADGVGSRPYGDRASRLVIDGLQRWLVSNSLRNPELGLGESIASLNHELWRAGQSTNLKGMATTLVAALVSADSLWVANVGDSRAYLVRRDSIERISVDHSLEEATRNRKPASEAHWRGAITRCVGALPDVQVDIFGPIVLHKCDQVVLCSDGLYSIVAEEEIAMTVRTMNAGDAADSLLSLANQRQAPDNVSVVVLSKATGLDRIDSDGLPSREASSSDSYE